MNLSNHTVLLTGATGGMGNAITQQLASQQAHIVATGRSEAELQHLANRLRVTHTGCRIDIMN